MARAPEAKPAQTFSKDQLIIPETQIPQGVSEILKKAEKAGFNTFESYRLSGAVLTKDTDVEGWNKKPENWYWDQIQNGKIAQDAAKLPDVWVLIDKTKRPDYENGKQLYQNDPFANLLKKLRKEGKIQNIKGIPETSRFAISHDELVQVVLPEIAKLLGIEASAVKLPKEIEFNVIGNMKHPEWGEANTWEWFADRFEDGYRLFGGFSDLGGLTRVHFGLSDFRNGYLAFRPLVVVSTKA